MLLSPVELDRNISVFCVGGLLRTPCDRSTLLGFWLRIRDIDAVLCVGVRLWDTEVAWDVDTVLCVGTRLWDTEVTWDVDTVLSVAVRLCNTTALLWVASIRCDDVIDVTGDEGWIAPIEETNSSYVWSLKDKNPSLIHLSTFILHIRYKVIGGATNEGKKNTLLLYDCRSP